MSDFDIHLYECDPCFYGCAELYDNFHVHDKAFYSLSVNWDTLLTFPQFMDENTNISAGYAESTDPWVENQDMRGQAKFPTGCDAEYQEASEYTDEPPTSGNAETTYYNGEHAGYDLATHITDAINHDESSGPTGTVDASSHNPSQFLVARPRH
ncbi:hypothetical protein K439DRAFT_1623160 [Ramaria rubella]|nr:hypothetical protein K439DRAFT_1623160 [Ramaria rubella]